MKRLLAVTFFMAALSASAAPAWFILLDGDGTITLRYERFWNTPKDMPGQLVKLFAAPATPDGVAARYWAWNGSAIVEAGQAVKDAVDAAIADAEGSAKSEKTALSNQDPAVRAVFSAINDLISGRLTVELSDSDIEARIRAELEP